MLIILAALFNLYQLYLELNQLAHVGIILLSVFWLIYGYQAQYKLPCAISYHKTNWRFTYDDARLEGILDHGVVIGPLAYLKLHNSQKKQTYRLWISYWQVKETQELSQGNWRQLVTMIRSTRP